MTDSVRLKWLLTESDIRAGADAGSFPLLSVSISWGVRRREASDMTTRAASDDLSKYKVCRAGDLVINRMRAFQGALGIAPEDGVVSPDYAVLRVDQRVEKRWLNYFLTSGFAVATMASLVRGIGGTEAGNVRTPRLNVSDLQSMTVPLMPGDEQRAVADYLDRETARIDTLIEEQQRLIEMLRGRRQDLVRAAVLGSANPFSPPPEAAFTAIGHHFSVTLGKMLDAGKAVRSEDLMLPYIRAGNIQDAGLKLDDVKQMPYSEAEASNLNLLKGDLLVVEGGAVGTNVLLHEDMPEWSFQKTVNRLRPLSDWSSAWLGYVLRTYRDIGVMDIVCNRSTIPHLTAEKLRAMRIPSVEPEEQVRVAAILDHQTAEIDVLITETEQFIELARERRAGMITAAVTGQIDVQETV
ncbi:restriction endonuclease subunit S [Rhodococcus erythropolis]|uniref:restriction endonuclease subunit S n=1 Tax=Rhodococcus erythropolis TaxID=1833 RepID=UPI0033A77A31